jgi:antiviral defense system Shedu protein SduA
VTPRPTFRIVTDSHEHRLSRDPLRDFHVAWDVVWPQDVKELERVLKRARDERPLQAHIEDNPFVLVEHLGGGHGRWVIPQKRLGGEFVTDFMICERDSNGNHWKAVELESPGARRFTKKGEPSAELNHAIQQIRSWRRWLTANIDYARRPLDKSGLGLTGITGNVKGLIIMGRRERDCPDNFDPGEVFNQIEDESRITIHSYDWLVDSLRAKVETLRRQHEKRPPKGLLRYRYLGPNRPAMQDGKTIVARLPSRIPAPRLRSQ